MRQLILAATSIAFMMALATPGETRTWCRQYQGMTNCAYSSHAECRASVSGRGGSCVQKYRTHSAAYYGQYYGGYGQYNRGYGQYNRGYSQYYGNPNNRGGLVGGSDAGTYRP